MGLKLLLGRGWSSRRAFGSSATTSRHESISTSGAISFLYKHIRVISILPVFRRLDFNLRGAQSNNLNGISPDIIKSQEEVGDGGSSHYREGFVNIVYIPCCGLKSM